MLSKIFLATILNIMIIIYSAAFKRTYCPVYQMEQTYQMDGDKILYKYSVDRYSYGWENLFYQAESNETLDISYWITKVHPTNFNASVYFCYKYTDDNFGETMELIFFCRHCYNSFKIPGDCLRLIQDNFYPQLTTVYKHEAESCDYNPSGQYYHLFSAQTLFTLAVYNCSKVARLEKYHSHHMSFHLDFPVILETATKFNRKHSRDTSGLNKLTFAIIFEAKTNENDFTYCDIDDENVTIEDLFMKKTTQYLPFYKNEKDDRPVARLSEENTSNRVSINWKLTVTLWMLCEIWLHH
ncbi:hypothetical protein DMENIID0001_159210 [Sergentomyia squamirostris]